jgi:hypothetical protein
MKITCARPVSRSGANPGLRSAPRSRLDLTLLSGADMQRGGPLHKRGPGGRCVRSGKLRTIGVGKGSTQTRNRIGFCRTNGERHGRTLVRSAPPVSPPPRIPAYSRRHRRALPCFFRCVGAKPLHFPQYSGGCRIPAGRFGREAGEQPCSLSKSLRAPVLRRKTSVQLACEPRGSSVSLPPRSNSLFHRGFICEANSRRVCSCSGCHEVSTIRRRWFGVTNRGGPSPRQWRE